MTNAGKIRNMSDEDLANFLSDMTNQCESNTSCNQHCYGCYEEYCDSEKCLKWLQSEVIAQKGEPLWVREVKSTSVTM